MGVGSSFLDLLPEGGIDELVKSLDKKASRISKKRTKAQVVQTVEQPDGKVLEKRSDGSQRRISPDGSSVETFKDGSVLKKTSNIVLCKFQDGSMLQISDTGDIIQKDKEGSQLQLLENKTLIIVAHADGRQLQWDIEAKTGTEDHPDGSKLEWNEDAGNRVELKVDGTIITTYSDGCVITKSTDGQLEQANPDGTRIISYPDGRRTQHNADGSRIEFFPDGSRVDYRADGVVIKQGSAAQGKVVNNGIDWDTAKGNGGGRARKGSSAEVPSDEDDDDDDYSDSDFEDAEVAETDAVVSGGFVVRGANFKNPKEGLSKVETKILKEALSVIPYEMGLDVTAKDVIITAEPGSAKGTMKISFRMRLDQEECDAEMAEEVFEEVEESLTEKGGTVFANSLARTAKELHYARWLTENFACSFVSADSALKVPPSWKPAQTDEVKLEAESSAGSSGMADLANVAAGKSKASLKMLKMQRKLKRASKFKTLQGSIKIKGVCGSDFDRSNHHHNALTLGLKDIFQHLGMNESNLRIKLTNVLDAPRKDGLASASVDYHVTLRGNARDHAEEVVKSLKEVFGDSKHRKKFLTDYWSRIPESVGTSPQRKKRSKDKGESKHASPEAKGGSGEEKRKHHRKDKKSKKDKKSSRKHGSGPDFDSDTDSTATSPARSSGRRSSKTSPKSGKGSPSPMAMLGKLANSILDGSAAEDNEQQKRMLPSL